MTILGIIASSKLVAAPPGFESIQTQTLTGTQASISFTGIPGTFTHLQLRYYGFSNSFGTQFMEINGNTSTGDYRTHYTFGSGATASGGDLTSRAAILGMGYTGQFNTTYPTVGIIDLLDYTNTTKIKTIRGIHGVDTNNTGYGGEASMNSGWYNSGSAITSLRFYLDGGNNFTAGSKYGLYGIKESA